MSLGEDSVPGCYDDIEQTDCIFVAGANPAWCHPILWRRIEAAKAKNLNAEDHCQAIPASHKVCAIADIHLQLMPGTDIVLHHAIGRLLIEAGHIDQDFIQEHTEGFSKYRDTVMERSISSAAAICGIAEDLIYEAAAMLGKSRSFMTMWTMD